MDSAYDDVVLIDGIAHHRLYALKLIDAETGNIKLPCSKSGCHGDGSEIPTFITADVQSAQNVKSYHVSNRGGEAWIGNNLCDVTDLRDDFGRPARFNVVKNFTRVTDLYFGEWLRHMEKACPDIVEAFMALCAGTQTSDITERNLAKIIGALPTHGDGKTYDENDEIPNDLTRKKINRHYTGCTLLSAYIDGNTKACHYYVLPNRLMGEERQCVEYYRLYGLEELYEHEGIVVHILSNALGVIDSAKNQAHLMNKSFLEMRNAFILQTVQYAKITEVVVGTKKDIDRYSKFVVVWLIATAIAACLIASSYIHHEI